MREQDALYRNEERGFWALTRFEDVWAAVHEPLVFSSAKGIVLGGDTEALLPMMIMMDPPRHDRLRSLVSRAFTPGRIAEVGDRVRVIADRLIDAFTADGCDLVADFGAPLPTVVIAEMLGVPGEDQEQFKQWSNELTRTDPEVSEDVTAALAAGAKLATYFTEIAAQRLAKPRDDLVTALVHAEIDGERLSDEELLGFCVLLLVAGNETTTNLIGNASVQLARDHSIAKQLRTDPSLLPGAVEEFLRYDSPVQGLARTLTRDVDMHGRTMRQGEKVMLVFGAANRDPREFDDPDVLDIHRKPDRHLAFGHGVHYCLGASLARLESRIAFERLFERVPSWELEGPVEWIQAGPIRGPVTLPMQFVA